MADAADRAQEVAEALDRASARHARPPARVASRLECASCGETIEPARRAALPNCALCWDCQSEMEGRLK